MILIDTVQSAVTLAQDPLPPPTGPLKILPLFRGLMLAVCVLCGAAFAIALSRIAWARMSKTGCEAKTTKVLIGTVVAGPVSFAAYQFMGWIA